MKNRKRINTARDQQVAKSSTTKLGIIVATTDDGISIDLGNGQSLNMGIEKAIEVAATMMVALLPVAMRHGESLETISERFFQSLTEKVQAIEVQLDAYEASCETN